MSASVAIFLGRPLLFPETPLVRDFGLWPAKLLTLWLMALLVWQAKSMIRMCVVCGLYTLIVANNLVWALKSADYLPLC